MLSTIEKRNGELVPFDSTKVKNAIEKANREVAPEEQASDVIMDNITTAVKARFNETGIAGVEDIQDMVENGLMASGKFMLAKKYILYRSTRAALRKANTTDESVLSLVGFTNKDVMEENSNKNAVIVSTQRDLIAGEVSKDITRRILLPERVVGAHDEGALHFHDMDYFLQPMHNCDLVNYDDMFTNGTVMNGKMIETPKSFQVACTVMTQIIAAVSSSQYGGQSLDLKHLSKYLAISKEKYSKILKKVAEKFKHIELFGDVLFDLLTGLLSEEIGIEEDGEFEEKRTSIIKDFCNRLNSSGKGSYMNIISSFVDALLENELRSGVQTIQYQINTLMTTNGQTPFVTLFINIDEGYGYVDEQLMLYKEVLEQRIQGIKNEAGVYVTPPFPKLVYALDEHNCLKGGKYDWLTELAVKCTAKRMYPDYISAKKMREQYAGNVFSPMGCRSFLSPWKDENGNYKFEGRFNQGVVSLNLPQLGILANGDMLKFWELLEDRLALCYEALMCRHRHLLGTPSDVAPILWQHGAIARLKPGEVIDPLLKGGYSTLSLGYIGLYEVTKLMTGESHTTEKGLEFALKLMKALRGACDRWKEQTGLGFALYGTPAESLCYRFARIDRERFGDIKDITDKGYYTNSYHIDVREGIDVFSKFDFEAQFQSISSGGCISYAEIPNMSNNLEALRQMVAYIYDHILYGEFNTKSDYCHICGYDGEIVISEETGDWECPVCHNRDHRKMTVVRRTCGYLGSNFWNKGKTKEISQRVLHIGGPVVPEDE